MIPSTSRSTLSSKSEKSQDRSYDELRESHKRLKQKTRQLLKQYRTKRSLLEKKERQLTLQRAGLIKLQTLHQSVETNHYVVIHHLGQQIVQIAKLVATLWPECKEVMEELYKERENKLSDWILYIDNLSSWIVQKLVKISVKKRSVSSLPNIPLLRPLFPGTSILHWRPLWLRGKTTKPQYLRQPKMKTLNCLKISRENSSLSWMKRGQMPTPLLEPGCKPPEYKYFCN